MILASFVINRYLNCLFGGFHGKDNNQKKSTHNLAKHSSWNFERVNEVFLTAKMNCMHLASEKTHYSLRSFELKTKAMLGEEGGYLNELKYLINAVKSNSDKCESYGESI